MDNRQSIKILIVEDEIITAKALERNLTNAGYNVLGIATSGEEAIQKAVHVEPDLVLMDIRLKGIVDGVMAAQRIQTHYDIPVIYLTAHSDEDTLKRVIYSKPYGYIVKPFREDELHAAIERALHQHQLKQQIEGEDSASKQTPRGKPRSKY